MPDTAAVGEQRGEVLRRPGLDGRQLGWRERDAELLEELQRELLLGVQDVVDGRANRERAAQLGGRDIGDPGVESHTPICGWSYSAEHEVPRADQVSEARRLAAVDSARLGEAHLAQVDVELHP